MALSLQLVTGPTAEPVSLALAKQQCKVDFPDDDLLFGAYIVAARQYCERYTHRAFFDQTWLLTKDTFPLWFGGNTINSVAKDAWPWDFFDKMTIDIPRSNLVSITSVTYIDSSNTQQTLPSDQYYADITSTPGRIVPVNGAA